jgi:hypothetical protein
VGLGSMSERALKPFPSLLTCVRSSAMFDCGVIQRCVTLLPLGRAEALLVYGFRRLENSLLIESTGHVQHEVLGIGVQVFN